MINFNNLKGLSNEQIMAMANGQSVRQESAPFDKTKWFTAPEGLVRFDTPKQDVAVKMDVLAFPINGLMNKDLLDVGTFNTENMVYWNQSVMVHECFPESIVCNKTFDIRKANNDPICNECWTDKSIDFTKASKRYTIMLLRLHPNEALGITDYKFAYHIDTHGKFAKALFEEWGKACKRNDVRKQYFYDWGDTGCSIEVYFSKLKAPNGFEYYGTNDITFVPREKKLTADEEQFISSLNFKECIHKPTAEEYQTFLELFRSKAVRRNSTTPTESTPVKSGEKTSYDEPPVTVQPRDHVFAHPVQDDSDNPWS
jgi:hypothetical protein